VFAQRTWTCDIADAQKGESALFFLADGREMKQPRRFWRALDRLGTQVRFYTIEWAGRGRMPLRTIDGVEFVTLWTDVRLPSDVAAVDGPEAGFIHSARLDDVLAAVLASLDQERGAEEQREGADER
jgi:hypothetical protein